MRIPARIAENPIESGIAIALLLALLFGSAESGSHVQAAQTDAAKNSPVLQKM